MKHRRQCGLMRAHAGFHQNVFTPERTGWSHYPMGRHQFALASPMLPNAPPPLDHTLRLRARPPTEPTKSRHRGAVLNAPDVQVSGARLIPSATLVAMEPKSAPACLLGREEVPA